jgi:drug/metabolite transporter (DMT)-like permease
MVAGGLILGTIGIFVEEAHQDPMTTVFFRCFFGMLALSLWGAATGRLHELKLRWQELTVALGAGVLIVLNWVLFFAAIPRVSIAIATVLFHIQPFFVIGLGAWWLGERVSRAQVIACVVALAGLVLATGLIGSKTSLIATSSYQTGVALCLVGAVAYAGLPFIARKAKRVSSFALSWWQSAVGVLLTAWWPLWHGLPHTTTAWLWLAGLGSIHSGLAYVVLYAGMSQLRTSRVALLQFVYPLTAIVVDRVVYGHQLTALQTVGVLIMAGALWTVRRDS